jgi:8-oxo-dGTP pyrophosphatase MutT (NUDIX family)
MVKEEVVFEGRIFQVVELHQESGEVWEVARRAPGVRLIVKNPDGTFKLSKEHRHELGKEDIRLAGGKVFDKLSQYTKFLNEGRDIEKAVLEAAIKEAEEELGLTEIKDINILSKSVLGATVEWDLYIVEVSNFKVQDQKTHGHEVIEPVDLSATEIMDAIKSGAFNEDRMVPPLLRYLNNIKLIV